MECRVCSAEATGCHYAILVCRACAAFFRRTVLMKIYYECRKRRACPIYHGGPICRYCRMKKCLVVEMVTDGSELLVDYYVKGLRNDVKSEEKEVFNPADCLDNHEEFSSNIKSKISKILKKGYSAPSLPFKLGLCQQSAQACENHEAKYEQVSPKRAKEKHLMYTAEDMEKFLCDCYVVMMNVAEYFMEIEPFAKLSYKEKVLIYKNKHQTFIDVSFNARTVRHLGRDLNDTKMIMFDGHIMDFKNTKYDISLLSNMSEENVQELMSDTCSQMDQLLLKPFKRVNPDDFEVQYLLMKSMWNLEGIDGLSVGTMKLAEQLQVQLDDELTYYYTHVLKLENMATRLYKVHNLLTGIEKIAKVRERDRQMYKTFDIYKFDFWIDDLPS